MGATNRKISEDTSNLEVYSLVWLDPPYNNAEEVSKIQQKLRQAINYLKIFDDCQQCEDYIRSVSVNDRCVLLTNDTLALKLIPRIEQLRQVHSIYVRCSDIKVSQSWSQQYLKIKCVNDQLDLLIQRIQSDHKTDDSFSAVICKVDEPTCDFIHSQLLFNCVLRMEPNEKEKFITLCKVAFKDNQSELHIIHEFERSYSPKQALSWYSRKSFIYRILRKALRIQNIDMLLTMRFFIQDLYKEMELSKCFYAMRVYHSHLMTNEEVQLLENSIGQFISINSFLSASLDRGLALFYLYQNNDLQRVLFEIDVDITMSDRNTFHCTNLINYCEENEQIHFLLGSIFKIENILQDDEEIWIIQMKLCSENDDQLKPIFNILRNEYNYDDEKNLFSLGEFLLKQGNMDAVEKYYRRLADEFPHDSNRIIECYNALGKIARDKRDFESSAEWFTKSVKITTDKESRLIESYNNLGDIHLQNGAFKQAIEAYTKSMLIFAKTYGEDHPKLAVCFNNLAIAYKKERKFTEALEYHKKALSLLLKHLPTDHEDIAIAYNNIGVIYRHLEQYDLAIEHFGNALEIYKKTLSCSYAEIAKTFRNIGLAYEDKGDLEQTLLYYKKSATLYRRTQFAEYTDIEQVEEKIRNISSRLK